MDVLQPDVDYFSPHEIIYLGDIYFGCKDLVPNIAVNKTAGSLGKIIRHCQQLFNSLSCKYP